MPTFAGGAERMNVTSGDPDPHPSLFQLHILGTASLSWSKKAVSGYFGDLREAFFRARDAHCRRDITDSPRRRGVSTRYESSFLLG
jgi:hypothetical protein